MPVLTDGTCRLRGGTLSERLHTGALLLLRAFVGYLWSYTRSRTSLAGCATRQIRAMRSESSRTRPRTYEDCPRDIPNRQTAACGDSSAMCASATNSISAALTKNLLGEEGCEHCCSLLVKAPPRRRGLCDSRQSGCLFKIPATRQAQVIFLSRMTKILTQSDTLRVARKPRL